MIAATFISLLVLLMLGAPVFVALAGSALIAIVGFTEFPLMIEVQRMIGGVDKFSLMAVPFFILAANVMKTGGIAQRILNWAQTMVGHLRGGMAITTEIACMFFGAVSGSSPATVVAIGGLTYPKMIEQKYPQGFATGLITSSGSVALLIPPQHLRHRVRLGHRRVGGRPVYGRPGRRYHLWYRLPDLLLLVRVQA